MLTEFSRQEKDQQLKQPCTIQTATPKPNGNSKPKRYTHTHTHTHTHTQEKKKIKKEREKKKKQTKHNTNMVSKLQEREQTERGEKRLTKTQNN